MFLNNFDNLDSKEVFRWFEEISKIPRRSKHEKQISDFLVKFAKDRNLEVYQNKENNVIIKKEASKGYENIPPVIIQGHMDMVCEKTSESKHDFDKDPIELIVEGDVLRANNTTLGADDGIAVAYGLALLDSKDIEHPALEVLITSDEEDGMSGAFSVTDEHLNGKTLINLDSEVEGTFWVSSAGGINTVAEFNIEKEANNNSALKIEVTGLKGGHSGMEIDKQRANAIKILGRVLDSVKDDINIAYIEGGSVHNAIAKSAYAVITAKDVNKVKNTIEKLYENIKFEYRTADPNIKILISNAENVKECYKKELSNNVISFMMLSPDGVLYMSKDIEGLVQTSSNNGVLKEKDNKLTFTIFIRSSVESSSNEIVSRVKTLASITNSNFIYRDGYAAWEYDPNSKVRDIAIKAYKTITGKDPQVASVHVGLECGILKKALKDTDVISMGPNIYNVHTPREYLSISSVDRIWRILKEIIKNIK
ncbi:aminoacyl-histidine dipeptidase [Brachyspira hyodysenteriae]|uniref:Cytosol non-specific dipeptidase n=1 Tax=Brachyspira hyodysenteriae ATCC 27164 TaxID=1266923 RepID=A0A3B6VYC1_BRAHO|nr:aminoacyl-histidine dipeptidase [Brachyspira hyodysenteriae]ANN62369.1 aminoacyl-histidine dipeptidase [Brachyspira hyodysenteriae ATCC 27164]KLI15090.1 aminoacyl-histidine dipeptidase [Brachyspira hyodysenteriae]KLI24027.1 aminoacyl-histidine dipeptidase [Brachyspira hyodysenteriae]MCZ9923962.1 aminoacyl-histidine dipeptidase [Brachyspira hyodysenteriae]MDA0022579.1 aminoacyl-histidine dipeptidase [Brachyspira hyodysenteriae]